MCQSISPAMCFFIFKFYIHRMIVAFFAAVWSSISYMVARECRDLGHIMLYWQQVEKDLLKKLKIDVRNRGSNAFIKWWVYALFHKGRGGVTMLAVLLAALESDTDRQKFIEIYEKYHVQMERTAMRILKEQSDVEDAVQNAFMQMIRHFEKIFEIPCEELPFWIISIVKNEARAILRKNRRTVSLEDWDGFAEHIDDISGYTELVDLFTQLPETYRSVLELKMLHGYTDKEIAKRVGISETAVSSRATRGRTLLREIVEKEGFCV